jgi:hypothetical protein
MVSDGFENEDIIYGKILYTHSALAFLRFCQFTESRHYNIIIFN